MEKESNIHLGEDARKGLMRGVDQAVDVVKVTLGAAGSNVILEVDQPPYTVVTNDGVSIVQMIQLTDPLEKAGVNLIKEIASRSDRDSGDGTTTASVLAQAILHAGMELKGNPMEIKRSLDECLPLIYKSLDEQKQEITVDDVAQVATVSSEDEALGAMLQEIYQQIGREGFVELDVSNLPNTFYEITEGVRLRNAGYVGAYSTTEPGKAVYENPFILITSQKIGSLDDIEPALKLASRAGKNELVIYCDDIDMAVASELVRNHFTGRFKTHLIKAPTLWKDWITEDFAEITGATVIGPATGTTLRTVQAEHLGTCQKLITTKDETRVIGIKDISAYVEFLASENTDESRLRSSWLTTKAAVLKVGASTDTELTYKRLKAEDACNATRLALQEGIVPGGGVALCNASYEMPDTIGGKILRIALKAPVSQITENAGHNPGDIIGSIGVPFNTRGFDAKAGKIVDMWNEGIVDPVLVTKNSIKNALSVAGTVLTAPAVITRPKVENHAIPPQMPGMQ